MDVLFPLASTLSWAMFAVGVCLSILILLKRVWRYQRSGKRTRPAPGADADRGPRRPSRLLDAPDELLRWQVEMHDTARDLKAELDSKMSALQAIIRSAAQHTESLEAAIARAEALGVSSCRDALQAVASLDEVADGAPTPSLPPLAEHSVAELLQPNPRRAQAYALADAGTDLRTIAARIGATVGEVELMLSVRPPPAGPGAGATTGGDG